MFSRRAILQASVAGAASLVCGSALRSPLAEAAVSQDTALAAGTYELNQDWLFGGAYVSGAQASAYSEGAFTDVTLPHTVTSLSWGDWDPSTWQQIWIYRKHVNQAAVAGSRAIVDFQGVMTSATVYLNGTQVGEHDGGYLPWSVELTEHLAAGDNVLAIVVDSRWLDVPPDNFPKTPSAIDYLQPGGIYRDVGLRIVPEVFLSDVFAKPTNVLTSPGVGIQLTLDAAGVPSQPVTVTAELLDGSSRLGSATGTATITAPGDTVTTLNLTGLSGIVLWSPEHPKLYQVSATVTADGVSHTLAVTIGFRQATFQTDGFYLNGERYEIFGLNRHQLFPYTGMAAPERLQRRDAELLKTELNCNMVRCSHYPQSPYFLDACDELGLMVWEEPPGWQYVGDAAFQDIVLQNVQDMIVRDRNRPSVIVWATRLNETSSQNNQALYVKTRQLAETFDGSRQTTGAMNTQSTTDWAQDVFAYDDYQSANGNATLSAPVSGVPYLVSEAVGAVDGAPVYRWVDTQATLAIQAKMHAQVHDIAQSDSAYAGLLGWAGIDYASLNGGDRIWHNVKWPGVLDTFRVPKPGAAFYRSQTDSSVKPVILPVFFWDFGPGSPANGPGAGAMIATNCDQLQVFVADTRVATGTPDTADYAHLAHPPVLVDLTAGGAGSPELRIDGYVAGQKVTSLSMSSDTAGDRLVLTIEDASLAGDGSDMTRFTFRALDKYGNQRPYPTGDVTLSLTGPATLIVENPFSFEEYGGVGGGFIRSQLGGAGVVTVTATHPTLGPADGQLTVAAVSVTDLNGGASGSSTPTGATPPTSPSAGAATSRTPGKSNSTGVSRKPVLKSRVRSALAAVLSPAGSQARIAELLHDSGYTVKFDAPSAGRLVIGWYHVSEPAHVAGKVRSEKLLVAAASASIRRAGHAKLKLRLTARGRSLLRHARHERLTVAASFTPTGQTKTTATKVIQLRR